MSCDKKGNAARLVSLIRAIASNDRGMVLVAASPSLRLRLVEAAEAITERVGRAEMPSVIAQALPD
jgi:hypothetical protein